MSSTKCGPLLLSTMSLARHAAFLGRQLSRGRTASFDGVASNSCGLSRSARILQSSAHVDPKSLLDGSPISTLCNLPAVSASFVSSSLQRKATAHQFSSSPFHALSSARAFSGEPYQPALRHKRREHDVFDDVGVGMAVDFHELQAFRIFPDVLDEFQPMAELHVEYGEHRKVKHGAVLTPEWTQEPPKVRQRASGQSVCGALLEFRSVR